MNSIERTCQTLGQQVGANARGLAILIGSLDQAGLIDGKAIARSMRLDAIGKDEAGQMLAEIADLIDRIIDKTDSHGPSKLKGVD